MGSPVVPLCSGWVASPCVSPLFPRSQSRRLFPTSSPPSRFVFCQMFGLMMALMDGSHVSGSHLVIYLKTFQINRPQLSQSLSQIETGRGKSPLIRGLCNEAIFIARALKPTTSIRNNVQFLSNYENLWHVTAASTATWTLLRSTVYSLLSTVLSAPVRAQLISATASSCFQTLQFFIPFKLD